MKAFIFSLFVFAVFILIVNGEFESEIDFGDLIKSRNDLVKNINKSNEPTQNEKIRSKREVPWHWCGKRLEKKIAEVCPSCFDSPSLKIKRSIGDYEPGNL
uniref:Uncharacterized protein n=1 Tax=Panagrolaimus davidi TaxID=227884 RepID=A0A914PAD3_9BILA